MSKLHCAHSAHSSPLPSPIRLEVDGYTEVEVTALRQITSIDSLIKHAVASREFRIVTSVLANSEHIVAFTPYREAQEPAEVEGHLVGKTYLLELEV